MMTDNIFHENGEFSTSSAIVIHPDLSGIPSLNKASKRRDIESMVGEICGLVEAIHLEVCAVEVFKLSSIQAGAFLGKGQREKIATLVEELAPEINQIREKLRFLDKFYIATRYPNGHLLEGELKEDDALKAKKCAEEIFDFVRKKMGSSG